MIVNNLTELKIRNFTIVNRKHYTSRYDWEMNPIIVFLTMFTMFTLPSSTSTNTLLMLICCPVRPIVINSKFYISFHFWDLLLNISLKSNRISRMRKDFEWPSYCDKYNEKPQFQQKIISIGGLQQHAESTVLQYHVLLLVALSNFTFSLVLYFTL